MKIVFFTKDPKNIHNVYPDWIKNALAKEAGADEIALVKIEEIEEGENEVTDVVVNVTPNRRTIELL